MGGSEEEEERMIDAATRHHIIITGHCRSRWRWVASVAGLITHNVSFLYSYSAVLLSVQTSKNFSDL